MTWFLIAAVLLSGTALPGWQVAVVVLAAVVAWVLDRLIRPLRPCRVCGGSGRHALSSPRAYGNCWSCHGQKVPRLGARMVRRAIRRKEL